MRFIGLSAAASEAAFFLADRRVTAAIRQFRDSNVSVFVRLGWMGFRQEAVEYGPQTKDRNPAALPWLERVDALANAVTPFSDLPLRAGIAAGLLVLAVGLMCAAAAFLGISVGPLSPGWILLLSGILVVGGLNLLLLGVIGAYVWRAIDGLSARPRHLVERRFGAQRKSTRELSL
jgi:dolichol-phosphate mannosyltransferase